MFSKRPTEDEIEATNGSANVASMKSYKMSEMKQLKVFEEPLQQQLEQLHALWFFAAHLQAADLTMSHSEGRGASSYLD